MPDIFFCPVRMRAAVPARLFVGDRDDNQGQDVQKQSGKSAEGQKDPDEADDDDIDAEVFGKSCADAADDALALDALNFLFHDVL